ncbi:endocuticle structural protein SgAbd-6-like [Episyrphus balteatus]|uniref:endocuticle structural protein SgAbd-6-like n=1 Tax=Episyrphus balteatus TaxID=286459 RepID=UPI002484F3DB|nr:endocuticle structural protein SgAbd-6-like [Episyrphus balteatus]
MKFVIVFVALIAVCSGAAISSDAEATVLRDNRKNDGINGYEFNFETSNGINRNEAGVLKPVGEVNVITVSGDASWIAPDGTPVNFKFTADENGFHPIA